MYQKILIPLFILMLGCKKETNTTITNDQETDSLIVEDNKTQDIRQKDHTQWSKNAVIYEVNIRQFSKEGTFNAVTEQLDRIKDLGVDVIWLMPIHPIGELNKKGELGSYYAVKDYKAVNPNYGSLDDFKNLVDTAHQKGLKVIIDWVANHSSPDNVWVKEHLDYYTKDSLGNAPIPTVGTDWVDVADLNYDNHEMRAAMQDAMKFWVTETNIDGFRCDVAEMVPMDFWEDTRKMLEAEKPLFMLAEGADPELFKAFDMIYGWPFKDLIVNVADGEKKLNAIEEYVRKTESQLNQGDIIMYFTTNHDENSWSYLEGEKFGSNLQNYQVLTYCMGGMPLIYSGQESGLKKQLEFFDKDTIDWRNYEYTPFYKNLNQILKNNEVLWNNTKANYEILSAENQAFNFIVSKNDKHLAVLQNYSGHPKYVSKISLNGLNLQKNLLGNQNTNVSEKGIEIPPHSTVILSQ